MAWSWTCEDDEEALGLVTILERKGLAPRIVDVDGAPTVFADDDAGASALERRLTAHYVRRVDRDRHRDVRRRQRRGWVMLGGLGLMCAVLLALFWP